MSGLNTGYVSYLLRMWQAGGDDEGTWRASLESAQTGERETFANLEALFAFLRAKAKHGQKDGALPDPETPAGQND